MISNVLEIDTSYNAFMVKWYSATGLIFRCVQETYPDLEDENINISTEPLHKKLKQENNTLK